MIAAVQSTTPPASHVMSVAKFERFFRIAAGLDVDKQDLKRYSDFINQKIYDLLLRGQGAGKGRGRAIREPFDLPITKGLQESIHQFRKIDEQIELRPILDQITLQPPLNLAYGEETEARLPEVVGGLSLALARAFQIIDGRLKNTHTAHGQRGNHDQGWDGWAGRRYFGRGSPGGRRRYCSTAGEPGGHWIVSQSLALARRRRRRRCWCGSHSRSLGVGARGWRQDREVARPAAQPA